MYTGLTEEICRKAWEAILPSIIATANWGLLNKFAGTIVVLDPNLPDCVVFEESIDTEGRHDEEKYQVIARYKAQLTARTGLPSRVVQQEAPYLYKKGDTKWGGSTITNGGLIVAFSGVQAVFDEMIAEWMTSAIVALCRLEMTREGGVMENPSSFLLNE